jgi:hypothetical protein
MVAYKNSSKNTGKMNIQPILNKNSSHVRMESEFDMLGIVEKLVKYVVHLFKKEKKIKKISFTQGIVIANN